MATREQHKMLAHTATTSVTATLDVAATSGNLLAAVLAVDKDAGTISVPTGWTQAQQEVTTSVSGAMVWRIADGTASDDCTWTLGTAQSCMTWICEVSGLASSPYDQSVEENPGTTAVSTITIGPTTTLAASTGWAVAMLAIDTVTNWSVRSSWSGGFTELVGSKLLGSNPGLVIADIFYTSNTALETTVSTTSGSDQVYGAIGVFSETAGAADPVVFGRTRYRFTGAP